MKLLHIPCGVVLRSHICTLVAGLSLALAACGAPPPVVNQPVPAPAPDPAVVAARVYYDAAMDAMDHQAWMQARDALKEALAILDTQPQPRDIQEKRRVLRVEIEQTLAWLFSLSDASQEYADEDSLYAEETGVTAALTQLLDMMPEAAPVRLETLDVDASRFDMPVVLNPRVYAALYFLRTTAAAPFSAWLNAAHRYAPMIQSIFDRAGLPRDLAYVALIGSGYHPRAVAASRAKGLWQFDLKTAGSLGLQQTPWIDERFDALKATRAAAEQFQRLYRRFGDWALVIAAHFSGAESVQAAMESAGASDYWRLDLPAEAMHGVPLTMAAAIIAKNPGTYGFRVNFAPPLTYETVVIDRSFHLETIAEGMGVPVEHLKRLNPELRLWQVPPDGYTLKIPIGARPRFLAWRGVPQPAPQPLELALHTVRRGETISSIARRYGVSVDDIVAENEIRRPNRLKIGQVLFIPVPADDARDYTAVPVAHKTPPQSTAPPAGMQIVHRVRRGETLASIGRRYGVSVAQLQRWNGIRNPRHLQAGQTLTIWVPAYGQPPPAASNGEPFYYTVRPGDTLWDIARLFDTTIDRIRAANGLGRRAVIHPGDRLKIGTP